MALHDEILEQPAVLGHLITRERPAVEAIAQALSTRDIRYILIAARGSSDHAGLYAKYLWGAHNGLPVALATPSLFSLYQKPPRIGDALVVGFSQSGQSPDIVSVVAEGRRQGALTVAITNTPTSPLAAAADLIVDLGAGTERAVAATKTYSAQLMATAMLSTALAGGKDWETLEQVPAAVTQALTLEPACARACQPYRDAERCFVLGRGFNYATAFELALKLKELCYLAAESYSSADFRHGPIAVVESGFPVFAIAPTGVVRDDVQRLLERLRRKRGAQLVVVTDDAEVGRLAHSPLYLPASVPEWLSPITSIIPGQLFAYHLTLAKGYDSENPRGLGKVTETM